MIFLSFRGLFWDLKLFEKSSILWPQMVGKTVILVQNQNILVVEWRDKIIIPKKNDISLKPRVILV